MSTPGQEMGTTNADASQPVDTSRQMPQPTLGKWLDYSTKIQDECIN